MCFASYPAVTQAINHQENANASPVELYVLMSLECSVLKICLMFTGKAKQTSKRKIFFSDVYWFIFFLQF